MTNIYPLITRCFPMLNIAVLNLGLMGPILLNIYMASLLDIIYTFLNTNFHSYADNIQIYFVLVIQKILYLVHIFLNVYVNYLIDVK